MTQNTLSVYHDSSPQPCSSSCPSSSSASSSSSSAAKHKNYDASLLTIIDHDLLPVSDPIRIRDFKIMYVPEKNLSSGRFGQTKVLKNCRSNMQVAARFIQFKDIEGPSKNNFDVKNKLQTFFHDIKRILEAGKSLSQGIYGIHGVHVDHDSVVLLTEFFIRGTVKDVITVYPIDERRAIRYCRQAAEALEYLHDLKIPVVHSDVRAANLFITTSDSIKLADFGLFRELLSENPQSLPSPTAGSAPFIPSLYVAPEILRRGRDINLRQSYQPAADVWALGCTLIEMLTQYPPYYEYFASRQLSFTSIAQQQLHMPYESSSLVPTASEYVCNLVRMIFVKDPDLRPSAGDIVQNATACENRFRSNPVSAGSESEKFFDYLPDQGVKPREKKPRRRKKRRKNDRSTCQNITFLISYCLSRILIFLGFFLKIFLTVCIFLFLGIGTLLGFFLIAAGIVYAVREMMAHIWSIDVAQPSFQIIAGILVILLFALLFSCCMVALGEYKFRIANKSLYRYEFLVRRPSRDIRMCGVRVIRASRSERIFGGRKRSKTDNDDDTTSLEIVPNYDVDTQRYADAPTPVPSIENSFVQFHVELPQQPQVHVDPKPNIVLTPPPTTDTCFVIDEEDPPPPPRKTTTRPPTSTNL